jgi:hypothetical protein
MKLIFHHQFILKKFVRIVSFKDAVSAGNAVRSTELLGFINNKLERLEGSGRGLT